MHSVSQLHCLKFSFDKFLIFYVNLTSVDNGCFENLQTAMNKKFSIKIENMKYQMSNCVKTQFCV